MVKKKNKPDITPPPPPPPPLEKEEPQETPELQKDGEELSKRDQAIAAAIKAAEKQFGRGTIMDMGATKAKLMVEVIPTGSLALDKALIIGGYPRGRIVEVYGPESSGKTTLTLHAIAEAQKKGGKCMFIDAEHALDIHYAEKLGVKTKELYVSQPDHGEQALEVADMMVRSGGFDLIVIDSVAALVPKAELEGDMGDSHIGLQARLMSQALRKLSSVVNRSRTIVYFINQIRMKIGVMFGNPETTTGGNALKFYASIRLDIRAGTKIKEGDDAIGSITKVKVVKNKLAPPFRDAQFPIIFGEGISQSMEVLDLGVEYEIITKNGTFYSYGEEKLGQGRSNAVEFLKENPKMLKEIHLELIKRMGLRG